MHTRCVIKCFKKDRFGVVYKAREMDFGIPFQDDHSVAHMHPKVDEQLQPLQKIYHATKVEFRDC